MTAAPELLLMTPGPTRVPERVLRAGARPMIHHRTPEFSRELSEMLDLLAPVFGTTTRILPIHTTGRGAMEAAVCNFLSAEDEIVVCCNGKFGELWARLAESYGVVVHRVARHWARDIDLDELDAALAEHPATRAVALPFGDTSTGVRNDVESIARLARSRGVMVWVDGVSSLGGMPFGFDAWDVDVAVTASQKCLMSSPGLAFAAVSARAWAAGKRSQLPRNYWDLRAVLEHVSLPRPETPGTPPVHIVLQVAEALRVMHEEGLDAVFSRHERMAAFARERISALGLALQCPTLRAYSATLTAVALPAHVRPDEIRAGLRERGILTAAGMGPFQTSSLRIGHMGDIGLPDVQRTLDALGDALASLAQGAGSSPAAAALRGSGA